MDGVLNVDKPAGPTSHDIVAAVRRAAGVKRVGHGGTLDPMATGVLIVCLGQATRIVEYLTDWRKSYRATAVLGVETDTEDATGEVVGGSDCRGITLADVEAVIPRFVGSIMQVPPMVSAVHHEGRRLYDLARKGEVVERPARPVEVFSMDVVSFQPGEQASLVLDIVCSSGTYVRTLCKDIGRVLGCGAHMAGLRRTAVGPLRVEGAVTMATIEAKAHSGSLEDILIPVDEVLREMPSVTVTTQDAVRIAQGTVLPAECVIGNGLPAAGTPIRIRDSDGVLVGVGILRDGASGLELKPEKIFVSGRVAA